MSNSLTQETEANHLTVKTLETGLIRSSRDIVKLNIIDWNRLNGYWNNLAEALDTIASWFVDHAQYSIIEHDISLAPQRDDFPGWDHVGGHEKMGRLYWNDFHDRLNGKLIFSDSPDFYGELYGENGKVGNLFYGDIGQVSASAFAHTQKHMSAHDLWISVLSETRQVVIEPLIDINFLWSYRLMSDEDKKEALKRAQDHARNCSCCKPEKYTDYKQLQLF